MLPEKHCNFDCIFCPIGRSSNKVDTPLSFDGMDNSLNDLERMIETNRAELVYINSKGEALINDKIDEVISLIKSKGIGVRLLSNGYLLAKSTYIETVNKCDEVIGEIKATSEEDFQKCYYSNVTIYLTEPLKCKS